MKNVRKLNVKWRPRLICVKIATFSLIAYLGSFVMMILFSEVTDKQDVWLKSYTISSIIFFTIITCMYIYIIKKAKNKKMIVYCQEKICKKGNKKLYYTNFNIDRTTLLQKMFGLVTVEFRNQYGHKLIFKDVSKEILNYL